MEGGKKQPVLTLEGNIDEKDFIRFAMYDSFNRKKAWRNPLLFALIMAAFALICLGGRKTHAEAVLLGSVLLGIGVVLPVVWVGMYLSSVRRQAKANGLSREKPQYSVTLLPDKIQVTKGKERAEFPWENVYLVRKGKECLYIYVSASRAFLLPDCEKTDAAWEIIRAHVSAEKISA